MRLAILALGLVFIMGCAPNYGAVAQCITDNGATFYGAFWCPHCAVQKETFGSAINNINYVECSTPDGQAQTQICKQKEITSYPTWEFSDGSRLTGEQSIETLASRTGCSAELP